MTKQLPTTKKHSLFSLNFFPQPILQQYFFSKILMDQILNGMQVKSNELG